MSYLFLPQFPLWTVMWKNSQVALKAGFHNLSNRSCTGFFSVLQQAYILSVERFRPSLHILHTPYYCY